MLAPRPVKLTSQRDVNLWRIPLQVSLGAIALFGVTMIPDVLDKYGVIHIPSWLTMGSIDDARAILSAMMGAVATVLALIFSVALLVLSMVATLFGPRLLYRFLQDWVTQVTIGLFMAAFIYVCLCFLVTHQDVDSRFVPQISLLTSWVLVVGSFSFLVYYSHRIATSIQNPDMIARIVDDLYPSVVGSHERGAGEGTGTPPDDAEVLERAETGGVVACPKSGYLQHLDHAALVAAAREAGALVVLRFRPGQFVLRGERLASVVPSSEAGRLEAAVDRHVVIGRHRTLTQDSEFGIAQVVEIAIRALSPAVNDTFTGVACVDWLADALLTLADKPPLDGQLVRHRWRAPRVDAGGPDRAARQARVRPDPPGLDHDARGAHPAARRDPAPEAAVARSSAPRARRPSGGHPRRGDRARPARPPRSRRRLRARAGGRMTVRCGCGR